MKFSGPLPGGSRGGGQQAREREGLLFVQANTEGLRKISAAGRSRGISAAQAKGLMLGELKTINTRLAGQLAELVAAKLDQSRVDSRRGVSSGRLEKVILDPRNRQISPYLFGVGRKPFMDKSAAKYWRSIEVGTTQFVGNPIKPGWLWGNALTGAYGGTSRFGAYPLAGGTFSVSGMDRSRSGRIRPMGPSYAYRALVDQGYNRRRAFLATRKDTADVIIKRPIAAHHMFRDAWREFDGVAQGRKALREAMYRMGLLGPQ